MINLVFIIFLTMFSLLSTIYLYKENYRKNVFDSNTFKIEGDKSEVFQKIKESSRLHGWILIESSNDDYLRYKIPFSMFFWGGIVKVFLISKINQIEINFQKRPIFIKSKIQDSILEKHVAEVLEDISIGKISRRF